MKPLITKLREKIQTEGRVSYGAMCQLCVELGYKASTGERRCRDLMEDGIIHPVWATSKRNTRYIAAYTAEKVAEKPKKVDYKVVMRDGTPVAVPV